MTCPNCDLENLTGTEWCECGYNFGTQSSRYCRSGPPLITTLFYIA
jgi:hypothetical protein